MRFILHYYFFFFFSSRRRHTRSLRDWSSDVCSSDLAPDQGGGRVHAQGLAQSIGVEGPARIPRMMHGPLEFDAVEGRRTVLETDHRDETLRLGPGADRSRRRNTTGRDHVSEPNSGPAAGQPTTGYPSVTTNTRVNSCPTSCLAPPTVFRPDVFQRNRGQVVHALTFGNA